MNKETLRMQMLAGVITEGEYVAIVNKEIEEADKASLNESMIGGIVGIGAINQIPPRAKTDYEMAFEHFLGERQSRIENPNQDPYTMEEGEVEEAFDFPKMDKIEDYDNPRQKWRWKGESISKDELIDAVEKSDDYTLVTYLAVSMADPDGNLNSLQNLLVKKEIDKRGLLKNN
jgi:hypothetical protein